MIINLMESKWIRKDDKWVRDTQHKGITLTKTGWKNFDLTKHRRGWRNECAICGKKCVQALGNQYEKVCIDCADVWLENSALELENINNRIREQREFIKNNKIKLMETEIKTKEIWEKQDILDKLESEQ